MLTINDKDKFNQIVSEAICKTAENAKDERSAKRWIRAIEKAVGLAESQPEFITWQPETNSVLVWNQESNEIYEANGVCRCEAYWQNQPCKHRALAKLLKSYFAPTAPEKAPVPPAIGESPYLKQTTKAAPVKVGNYRI